VVNQLRELLGEHLSPVIIFEAPTIAALAELLGNNYPDKVAMVCENPDDGTQAANEVSPAHARPAHIPVASREMRRVKRSALHR
jgi:hypothetical protein